MRSESRVNQYSICPQRGLYLHRQPRLLAHLTQCRLLQGFAVVRCAFGQRPETGLQASADSDHDIAVALLADDTAGGYGLCDPRVPPP